MATQQKAVHEGAKSILKRIQQLWGKEHEFLPVDESSFHHLDLRFYSRIETELKSLGFSKLGDVEDICIKESKPDPRTFIRVMTNSDATICAGVYHAKPQFPWPLLCWVFRLTPLKIFEFETEFKNGVFLTTTIATALTQTDSPKELIKQYCPKNATVQELFAKHKQKADEIIKECGTEPVRLNTLDEVCKSQNRAISATRKHMEENGWVSKEYLIKQHGRDDQFISDVYEEVQRLVRKQLITGEID